MGIGQKRPFRGQSGFSYSIESLDYLFFVNIKKKDKKICNFFFNHLFTKTYKMDFWLF